jgi:hypothetical protein
MTTMRILDIWSLGLAVVLPGVYTTEKKSTHPLFRLTNNKQDNNMFVK